MRNMLVWTLSVVMLAACGGKDDEGTDSGDTTETETTGTGTATGTATGTTTGTDTGPMAAGDAQLRVLHLSPDAPNVDVYVDDGATPVISDLAFPTGTDYLTVPGGTYNVKVVPAGADIADAVLDLNLDLAADTAYTAVAWNAVSALSALALVDDDANIPAGSIRLQVTHAALGVGQVDIWEMGSGTPLITDFDFGATGTLDVPAGAYTLGLDLDDDAVADVQFDVPDLGADLAVNVFAVTDAAGSPFLLAQLPDGATARVDPAPPKGEVRVLHVSPEAPAVDVWIDDAAAPAITNLAFTSGTAYVALPAGLHNFKITPTGAPIGSAVLDLDLTVDVDTKHAAVAYGGLANLSALWLTDNDDGIPAGYTRLQVSHTANGVGQVDVWEMSGGAQLIPNLNYGASATLDVPAGAYTLGLDTDNNGTAEFTFDVPNLGGDTQVNVHAVLDATGPFLLAHLPDGSTARVDAN